MKHEKDAERVKRGFHTNRVFAERMELITEIFEMVIAVIVLAGFVISVLPLLFDMPGLMDNSNDYSFRIFLEHAFNLEIGIEFVRMLIKHTPGSALGVLVFAIARHMVLDGANGFELFMGVLSIAGIFAIRKFLYVDSFEGDAAENEESVTNDGQESGREDL